MVLYTNQEVIELLNRMKKEAEACEGFIIGTLTKAFVFQMIDEKIKEVNNKPEVSEK